MTKVNEADLMKKIMMFSRKARMGGPRRMMGPGRPCMPPKGFRGPTDGCFHPGPSAARAPHGPAEPGKPMPPFPGMPKPPLTREHILVIIGKHPDGVRQKAIADEMGINQSSTSELINKLESDGYIVREVDPDDKRATRLFLTEKGQARAAEVEDERAALFKDAFSALTEEEKQTLSDLLDKLLKES